MSSGLLRRVVAGLLMMLDCRRLIVIMLLLLRGMFGVGLLLMVVAGADLG